MNYRKDKYGRDISILGYGCMRFSGTLGRIDVQKAEEELCEAIEAGVNYLDTAYVYPGSEAALGEILERRGLRDRVYIATKLPHYLIRSPQTMDKIFAEQLRRLRTDRIDYYLMHMLPDVTTWERLQGLGIEQWLCEKRRSGAIGQVGFSYHGNAEQFCRLVDVFPWDFCQIQYNYMDENTQAGRRGLQYAHQKGLPVFIMEPLRGGKLVSRLPERAKRIFAAHERRDTPAGWALRWLWDQPEVTCVLSGMNSMDTVRENLRTAGQASVGCLQQSDRDMLSAVAAAINEGMKVGCTACGYCMPCPAGVDIPATFAAYNRRYAEGKLNALIDYAMCTAVRRHSTAASRCVGCGKCEAHCPQHIPIRAELHKARRELEGPVYRIFRAAVERIHFFG